MPQVVEPERPREAGPVEQDESMAADYGETRVVGQSLGVEVQPMGVRTPDDFDRAYAAAGAARLDGWS
jgi:hypothetical protein